MNPSSAPKSTSNTVFSDLSDDCLLEIFKRLPLTDLCSVADVCRSFRWNAHKHFASPKFRNDVLHISSGSLDLRGTRASFEPSRRIGYYPPDETLILQHLSTLLRNFGFLVKSISVRGSIRNPTESESEFEKIMFHLIILYCSGSLTEMSFSVCNITEETENALRPLFLHLHKLSLTECIYSKNFGQTLSLWLSQIRELELMHDYQWKGRGPLYIMRIDDILRQSFPKLEFLSLRDLLSLKSNDLEEFLRRNRQLKKIGLIKCEYIDNSCFKTMAMHAPQIESIQIDRIDRYSPDNNDYKYVGKLNCLSTLELSNTTIKSYYVTSMLSEIHASNIPLQHLHVHETYGGDTDELVDVVSKLKTLKKLLLFEVYNLSISHILRICKQLEELLELRAERVDSILTVKDLLEIITCAQKLQSLHYFAVERATAPRLPERHPLKRTAYDERILSTVPNTHLPDSVRKETNIEKRAISKVKKVSKPPRPPLRFDFIEEKWTYESLPVEVPPGRIDLDAYMKMVQIVWQRREKTRLLIKLGAHNSFATNVTKDITRKYNNTLALEILYQF